MSFGNEETALDRQTMQLTARAVQSLDVSKTSYVCCMVACRPIRYAPHLCRRVTQTVRQTTMQQTLGVFGASRL